MPINFKLPFVGSVVGMGHRGRALTENLGNTFVRAFAGQPKDLTEARNHSAVKPVPKPRGLLPSLTIKRTTPFTAYASDVSVINAARKLPVSSPRPCI